jgi:UrcA family protein
MNKLAIIVILGAALLGGAPLASAQTQGDAPRIVVKFGDLNLQSQAGREAFERRLANGVITYCGGRPANLDLTAQHWHRACVKDATQQTFVALRRTDSRFAEIDMPMVLADR